MADDKRPADKAAVLAWDPDFTKLTEAEREAVDAAAAEMERGEYVTAINWD